MMRWFVRGLGVWALMTLVGMVVVYNLTRLPDGPMPDQAAQEWAIGYLQAARLGDALPDPPPSALAFTPQGPLITTYWLDGRALEQVVSELGYVEAVRHAATMIGESPVARHAPWARPLGAPDRPRFTISLVLGEGPVLLGVPFVTNLWLVPLRDGLVVRVGEEEIWMKRVEPRIRQAPTPTSRTSLTRQRNCSPERPPDSAQSLPWQRRSMRRTRLQ